MKDTETMDIETLVRSVADVLKEFDAEKPVHKAFQPGIGPFGEPQIVKEIAVRLSAKGLPAATRRTPDMAIGDEWGVEFKIARPFGDNGKEAEDWSVNLLHPYPGNVSLIGDALKLLPLTTFKQKAVVVLGYEHHPARISLDPLLQGFELLARDVARLRLETRVEERRAELVHPEHQVLRCVGWRLTQ